MPPEEREKLDRTKVVACVKSINGLAYKGKVLTDAAEVFEMFPWIFEQTIQGIMERQNFIRNSATK
jgi:hypothetical protein